VWQVDDRHVITTGGELIIKAEPVLTGRLQSDPNGPTKAFQALHQRSDPRAGVGEAQSISALVSLLVHDHSLMVALADIDASEVH
jgi:hypothetical protein